MPEIAQKPPESPLAPLSGAQVAEVPISPKETNPTPIRGPSAMVAKTPQHRRQQVKYIVIPPDIEITITERQEFVVETYLKNKSVNETALLASKAFGKTFTPAGIRAWLRGNPQVHAYLQIRARDLGYLNGWTKERWIRECSQRVDAAGNPVSAGWMKMIGQSLGYIDHGNSLIFSGKNQQIAILQANGEK